MRGRCGLALLRACMKWGGTRGLARLAALSDVVTCDAQVVQKMG